MTDKQFLNWIADRLVFVHGDSPNTDYVRKLREIGNASGPGPAAIPRIGSHSTGLKWAAGVFSVFVVVLMVWGALSV